MKSKSVKVSAVCPPLKLADVQFNTKVIIDEMKKAEENGVDLLVFPELTVCGYTCGELFSRSFFIEKCENAIDEILKASTTLNLVVIVGSPYMNFNCALVIQKGKVLQIVPKPTRTDGYFWIPQASIVNALKSRGLLFGNEPFSVSLGNVQKKLYVDFYAGVDVFTDADIVVKTAAMPTKIAFERELKNALLTQSRRSKNVIVYVNAGLYESTSDALYGGEKIICQNGQSVKSIPAFSNENLTVEIDFSAKTEYEEIKKTYPSQSKTPFIPEDEEERKALPEFVLNAAGYALKARMERSYSKTAVIGVSGGLDSTLALLIIERAFELMNRDKKDIIAVTMPGFGTTGKTYNNSLTLMRSIGASVKEIDITKSVLQHFEDIGHDREDYSVTYENAQARMRTMILMDIANKTGGLVVGTGDLSEIALGWSTYNGDHMSMYAVNAGLPKTLIRYLVGVISKNSTGERARVLKEIFEQEISPELLPPDKDGKIAQKTENLVGPYELHDYFLYAFVKLGYNPKEVYKNACETFDGEYDKETILKWLKVFFKRFTTQQFKRSCSPDSAAIGEITLSKKAFGLPSDLSPDVFLRELENL